MHTDGDAGEHAGRVVAGEEQASGPGRDTVPIGICLRIAGAENAGVPESETSCRDLACD